MFTEFMHKVYILKFIFITKKPGISFKLIPGFFNTGLGGFEPPNAGIKTLCLTAWR